MQRQASNGLPVVLCLEDDGTTVVRTLRPLYYQTALGLVVVPENFRSDGASMPRLFWRLIGHPFQMQYLREAILHDWLYRTQPCSRALADRIFYELLAGKVKPWRRKLIYLGLRLGGWVAWRQNRKEVPK